MPKFIPFCGIRYSSNIDLNQVIAPPYDVVDKEERSKLASRHRGNAIKIELPDISESDLTGATDNYSYAKLLLDSWIDDGILIEDIKPCFYIYKMTFQSEFPIANHREISTLGVLGALKIEEPGTGDVLPHENTIKKAKTDRLDLLRATRTNISPIWGLSLSNRLTDLLDKTTPPTATATDDDGVLHELWAISEDALINQISNLVDSASILIADGHHRYETSWNYRNEIRNENGNQPGDQDFVLAYIVELNSEQIHLQAIHRLLNTSHSIPDLLDLLNPNYEIHKYEGLEEDLLEKMRLNGENAFFTTEGIWLIKAKPTLISMSKSDLETKWLETALNQITDLEVTFQHGFDYVMNQVINGKAKAAILLNPVSIEQIKASSEARFRMPPKSTFFTPKPRTGMVFRRLK